MRRLAGSGDAAPTWRRGRGQPFRRRSVGDACGVGLHFEEEIVAAYFGGHGDDREVFKSVFAAVGLKAPAIFGMFEVGNRAGNVGPVHMAGAEDGCNHLHRPPYLPVDVVLVDCFPVGFDARGAGDEYQPGVREIDPAARLNEAVVGGGALQGRGHGGDCDGVRLGLDGDEAADDGGSAHVTGADAGACGQQALVYPVFGEEFVSRAVEVVVPGDNVAVVVPGSDGVFEIHAGGVERVLELVEGGEGLLGLGAGGYAVVSPPRRAMVAWGVSTRDPAICPRSRIGVTQASLSAQS